MKVAFVVARYGTEVNGGAELHCRMVAERLKHEWDIEIITTCAMDYIHWGNHFKKGICYVNGIKTHRFEVDYERPINTFNSFYNMLISLHLLDKNLDVPLDSTEHLDKLFTRDKNSSRGNPILPHELATKALTPIEDLEDLWLKLQGPFSSQLLEYIENNNKDYDVFIFFSATYCTSYYGLPIVADRSMIIPTLHREACMAFGLYQDFFRLPRHILYNTVEEMKLANQIFPSTKKIAHDIVGVGVETKGHHYNKDSFGPDKVKLEGPYILYLGRIEQSKGCLDLCHFFVNFNMKNSGNLTLVFAGKKICGLPNRKDVVHVGFVSEEEKQQLIKDALVVCIPSLFESLSMVLLEAWSLGTPTLVNGNCEVLKGHINRGNGGLCYDNEESFHKYLRLLLEHPSLRAILSQQGKRYVDKHYSWETVLNKYRIGAKKVAESNQAIS